MTDKLRKKELLKDYWRQYHAKHATVEKLEVLEKLWGIWRNLWSYELSSDELFELKWAIEGSTPKKGQRGYDDMYVDSQDVAYLRNFYAQLNSKIRNLGTQNDSLGGEKSN